MKWIIDYLYPRNFDAQSIPDLNGKVIAVTGSCAGLGYEIASQCAIHNASTVILLSVPSPRLEDAVTTISAKLANPNGRVHSVPVDLADLSSVFKAVDTISSITSSIDIIFANAGVSKAPTPLSKDGIETVFATNHLGHYALLTRLLPKLLQTSTKPNSDVRIVITSSSLAWWAQTIDLSNLTSPFDKKKYIRIDMYTRSKLANLLFGLKLAQHVRERGYPNILVNIGDPGIIFATGIHKQLEYTFPFYAKIIVFLLEWTVGFTIAEGALTLLFLGTSSVIRERRVTGQFYRPFGDLIQKEKYPKGATEELMEKLWEWSEDFVSRREHELRSV